MTLIPRLHTVPSLLATAADADVVLAAAAGPGLALFGGAAAQRGGRQAGHWGRPARAGGRATSSGHAHSPPHASPRASISAGPVRAGRLNRGGKSSPPGDSTTGGSGPPRPAPSSPSGPGSRTATTGVAGTPRSARSAPSRRTAKLQPDRGRSRGRITPCPPDGVRAIGSAAPLRRGHNTPPQPATASRPGPQPTVCRGPAGQGTDFLADGRGLLRIPNGARVRSPVRHIGLRPGGDKPAAPSAPGPSGRRATFPRCGRG